MLHSGKNRAKRLNIGEWAIWSEAEDEELRRGRRRTTGGERSYQCTLVPKWVNFSLYKPVFGVIVKLLNCKPLIFKNTDLYPHSHCGERFCVPLSNTGEKANSFPQIPCRKSRLKNAWKYAEKWGFFLSLFFKEMTILCMYEFYCFT